MLTNFARTHHWLFPAMFFLVFGTSAQAQISTASLPFVNDEAKTRIEKEYVASQKQNKALALTEAGGWGFVQGRATLEEAVMGALSQCQRSNLRHPCFVAAENDQLVFQTKYTIEAIYNGAIELLKRAALSMDFYSNEDRDDGISPTSSRRSANFHSPTPRSIPGAKTITTRELVELLKSSKPVLINVLDWTEGAFAIPGTIWIQGMGGRLGSSEFSQIKSLLAQVIPDKNSPLVLYCISWECWLSYNASLTAVELEYKNVYWYRGGVNSWNQARLPIVRTKLLKQF